MPLSALEVNRGRNKPRHATETRGGLRYHGLREVLIDRKMVSHRTTRKPRHKGRVCVEDRNEVHVIPRCLYFSWLSLLSRRVSLLFSIFAGGCDDKVSRRGPGFCLLLSPEAYFISPFPTIKASRWRSSGPVWTERPSMGVKNCSVRDKPHSSAGQESDRPVVDILAA